MSLKFHLSFSGFFEVLICGKWWISKDLFELSYLSTVTCGETTTYTEHMLLCSSTVSCVQEQNTHCWWWPILFWTLMYSHDMIYQFLNKLSILYLWKCFYERISLGSDSCMLSKVVKIWTVIHLKAFKDMKDIYQFLKMPL